MSLHVNRDDHADKVCAKIDEKSVTIINDKVANV